MSNERLFFSFLLAECLLVSEACLVRGEKNCFVR